MECTSPCDVLKSKATCTPDDKKTEEKKTENTTPSSTPSSTPASTEGSRRRLKPNKAPMCVWQEGKGVRRRLAGIKEGGVCKPKSACSVYLTKETCDYKPAATKSRRRAEKDKAPNCMWKATSKDGKQGSCVENTGSSSKVNAGLIAGIVIGVIAAIGLVVGIVLCGRK